MPPTADSHELWRKNAARQWQDDRYTVLFNEAVTAFRKIEDLGSSSYCAGLIQAYALVTGDAYNVAWEQVARAARELLAS